MHRWDAGGQAGRVWGRAHLGLVWVDASQVAHVTFVAHDGDHRVELRMVPQLLQPPLAVLKRNCTPATDLGRLRVALAKRVPLRRSCERRFET